MVAFSWHLWEILHEKALNVQKEWTDIFQM